MSKSKKNSADSSQKSAKQSEQDVINYFNQPDFWGVSDYSDESFWEEFFHLEELSQMTDELDPASFAITIQNLQTGELKTFSKISLKTTVSKLNC